MTSIDILQGQKQAECLVEEAERLLAKVEQLRAEADIEDVDANVELDVNETPSDDHVDAIGIMEEETTPDTDDNAEKEVQDEEEIPIISPPVDTDEEKQIVEMQESEANNQEIINPVETLMRFYNELGLATNLLAVSSLSVLISPHLGTPIVPTNQISNEPSSSTESPFPDITTRNNVEDLVIKALSMIACFGIIPEYHYISQKSLTTNILQMERMSPKKPKTAKAAPKTLKGKKWRNRILARKEKQKQQEQRRKAKEESEKESIQKDCDDLVEDVGKENELIETSDQAQRTQNYDYLEFVLKENDEEADLSKNETTNKPVSAECTNDYDYLNCALQSDAKENISESLSLVSSEDDADCLEANEKRFAQLDVIPGAVDVRWEEIPALVPEEEEKEESDADSSMSASSTDSRSGIPSDILSIEESLEQSFAEAMQGILEDSEPAKAKAKPTQVEIPQELNDDRISFVTAEEIAEQTESINDKPTQEQTADETNITKGSQRSLQSETKSSDEKVSIETILDVESAVSKVEVVVYGHDLLSSSAQTGYFNWCCWFDAFSPSISGEKKKASGLDDASLCLTETSSNSSSSWNSSSWLSFGAAGGTKKAKPMPWYIMPQLDPGCDTLDSAFLENLSSFFTTDNEGSIGDEECTDNKTSTTAPTGTSDDDEAFALSRLAIVQEFHRIRNNDNLCHSDRVMEMIYFSTTMEPPRSNENVLVLGS
eukprot:CAMPEP_0116146734 /NCGR_PEP_ID=MMETSP0329-20121206/17327_1 /TAXON_ID=697910 /ORGANISM="Pseudo-nitzschia arenysensis, Strain B593" /LENGTH=716 /DNA_ID=CAMNT_0003642511 /DNA_START=48 /DNA_END=2198 /DNA_ORIENTATION=-